MAAGPLLRDADRSDYIERWRDLLYSPPSLTRKRTGARGKEIMMLLSRRTFFKLTGASTIGWYAATRFGWVQRALAQIRGGTLDPTTVPKYQTPLLIPPVMPRAATITMPGGKPADYYEISMKQFEEQILPSGFPRTTVWGYGAVSGQGRNPLLIHNAPSLTIEAQWKRPVRIKWINELTDDNGHYLPHLLPVDQTLHWANPPGGEAGRDTRPTFTETPDPYTGPVPIVTHVHGAVGVGDESDGYAEAWYLPDADNIPAGYATEGTWYGFFKGKAASRFGASWGPGFATFQYPNANRASTIWYHDHALGMTRLNVYAGPAGSTSSGEVPRATRRCSTAGQERRPSFRVRPRGKGTSSHPTRPTSRSQSRSRTARSTLTGRCSIRTAVNSLMGPRRRIRGSSRVPTSPRSGTRSSSGT
jgi:hypothetical protein